MESTADLRTTLLNGLKELQLPMCYLAIITQGAS